jgi:hypothetical protein
LLKLLEVLDHTFKLNQLLLDAFFFTMVDSDRALRQKATVLRALFFLQERLGLLFVVLNIIV